jgi:hypothetical protein
MKTFKLFLICLIFFQLSANCLAQNALFTNIKKGETITNRESFPVAISIANFDNSNGYYWVAIASVKQIESIDWKNTILLYNEAKKTNDVDKKNELIKKISKWKIDLFWPKFYVPKSNYHSDLYDGGHNPLTGLEPEPMILVIMKVDDSINESFKEWFNGSKSGKGYPGFPLSKFSENIILGRCEIFFP